MTTFKIIRFFEDGLPTQVIKTGLTQDEAMAHCQDPETSSSTATSSDAVALTDEVGRWFDGWTKETP